MFESWSDRGKADGLSYCAGQVERAPETGKGHFQGYAQFSKQVRRATVSRIFGGCWCEPRKGSHEEAETYVTKEQTRLFGPFRWGTPRDGSGGKAPQKSIIDRLKEGASMQEVAEENWELFLRHSSSLYKAQALFEPIVTERPMPVVVFLWGDPGTGKTHYAKQYAERNGGGVYYVNRASPGRPLYWDNYKGERNIIIDEFYGWIDTDRWLRICDKYCLWLDCRGRQTTARWDTVWITSNASCDSWWKPEVFAAHPGLAEALHRRIYKIVELREDRSGSSVWAVGSGVRLGSGGGDYRPISEVSRRRVTQELDECLEEVARRRGPTADADHRLGSMVGVDVPAGAGGLDVQRSSDASPDSPTLGRGMDDGERPHKKLRVQVHQGERVQEKAHPSHEMDGGGVQPMERMAEDEPPLT